MNKSSKVLTKVCFWFVQEFRIKGEEEYLKSRTWQVENNSVHLTQWYVFCCYSVVEMMGYVLDCCWFQFCPWWWVEQCTYWFLPPFLLRVWCMQKNDAIFPAGIHRTEGHVCKWERVAKQMMVCYKCMSWCVLVFYDHKWTRILQNYSVFC